MSKTVFMIETGQVGLKLVDTAAVGYDDSWQAPTGATADTATIALYETAADDWSCQIVGGALTATPDTTTTDVPATWCEAAEAIPTPAKTAFEFTGSFLQDPNVATGFNRWLFEHDTKEAYLFVSFAGGEPPKLIGRVRVTAGTIGGEARVNLTSDFTLPLTRKPDIEFGNSTTSEVVEGAAA